MLWKTDLLQFLPKSLEDNCEGAHFLLKLKPRMYYFTNIILRLNFILLNPDHLFIVYNNALFIKTSPA